MRLFERVSRLLDVKNSRNRRLISVLALLVFTAGLFVASQRLEFTLEWNITTPRLAGMLLLLILTFAINALRTHVHSRIVSAKLSFADNARISLFGSAMNMLPLLIPAGAVLRMSNLVQHGGSGSHVTAVIGINYLLALASSLLLGIGMLTISGVLGVLWPLVLTMLFFGAVFALLLSQSTSSQGTMIGVLELLAVLVDAVRLFICFQLLGFGIELYQAAVLTISAVLGSAVSIVPAGLGIRELVGALISPLIAVLPAQAFLAIALNRVFGMAFFASLAGFVLATDRKAAI